jgi:hypothetical protein
MNSVPFSSPCRHALAAHPLLTSPVRVRRSLIPIRGLDRRHVAEHDFRRSVNEGGTAAAGRTLYFSRRVLQDVRQNFPELNPVSHVRSAPFVVMKHNEECRAWLTRILGSATR